jgi:hypothetical protein
MKSQIVIAIALVLGGCGKKSDSSPAASAGSAETPVAEPPPAPPFTGTLTIALVMSSGSLVKPLQPWDDAFARLQAKLGKPTLIDGKNYTWAAMEGDDCAYFSVEQEDGKQYKVDGIVVGGVQHPAKSTKGSADNGRGKCLEVLGKDVPPEDPSAQPAPGDDKPVSVSFVVDNGIKARSRWVGKPVTVEAKVSGIGGIAVTLADVAKQATLTCIVKDQADDKLLGKPVIAKGTFAIQRMMDGHGEASVAPELEHCEITTK